MFELKFDKPGYLYDNDPELIMAGIITIGDFRESVEIPTYYWTKENYMAQWKSAFEEVLSSDNSLSALIVGMHDPKYTEYIRSWPLYRLGNKVYVQSRLILTEQIDGFFQIENIPEYIGEREMISEDGELISEWEVSVGAIRSALNKLNRSTKEGDLNEKDYSEHFKSGLMIVGAIILVTIVTVPFTSIWVPIVITCFNASLLLALSLINFMNPKSQGNPIVRSFEQISKGCEFVSDIFRF
jgi:hypothetical protein